MTVEQYLKMYNNIPEDKPLPKTLSPLYFYYRPLNLFAGGVDKVGRYYGGPRRDFFFIEEGCIKWRSAQWDGQNFRTLSITKGIPLQDDISLHFGEYDTLEDFIKETLKELKYLIKASKEGRLFKGAPSTEDFEIAAGRFRSLLPKKKSLDDLMNHIKCLDNQYVQNENTIKALEVEQSELLAEKKKDILVLLKISSFDVDVIGNVIARLLSKIDNKSYIYYTASRSVLKEYYDEWGKGEPEEEIYPIKVIIPESYREEVFNDKDLNRIPLVIILNNNQADYYSSKICLYNNYNSFLLRNFVFHFDPNTINDDYFSIIEDFFDIVREYRLGKESRNITEEEINRLLDQYFEQYSFECVSYVRKKIKR